METSSADTYGITSSVGPNGRLAVVLSGKPVTVETVTDTYKGKTTTREVLTVKAPFNAVFNALPVPGRWFDRNAKVWRVPVANKPALWTAVQTAFKGLPLVSSKGTTTIV